MLWIKARNGMKPIGAILCILLASLAFARLHLFGDPRGELRQPREELLQSIPLPDSARRTLVAKCADCHSHSTRWPIYSRFAPISWLIEHDVIEGREHLNLSKLNELPADQIQAIEQQIAQQTAKGAMPPLSYRLVHWHASLGTSDREALAKLAPIGAVEQGPVRVGDAERGSALFERRCSGCHAADSDREGPHLRGAYGRRAGSVSGFHYSSAIRNSGVTWADATLDTWLRDSDSMLPGSAMGFSVPKAQDRSDLVAFLKSLR